MQIVYKGELSEFRKDVESHQIAWKLAGLEDPSKLSPQDRLRRSSSQVGAWQSSLTRLCDAVIEAALPDDCGVLIEYKLPSTSRRVDFIVSGQDDQARDNFVIIELKQWSDAYPVPDKSGVVLANVAGSCVQETSHPCYQAQSYCIFLEKMLPSLETHQVCASSCAYMHNYPRNSQGDKLQAPPNDELTRLSPLFGSRSADTQALGRYLSERVGKGRGAPILELLSNGKFVPTRSLVHSLSQMFSRQQASYFTLIDEQKVAYATILSAVQKGSQKGSLKQVVIVSGGPGTGKSVVAISVLVEMLRRYENNPELRNIRFVSPTASFKTAMIEMLSSGLRGNKETFYLQNKAQCSAIFTGSGQFFKKDPSRPGHNVYPENQMNVLICDEAHRLCDRQNMYAGKNQIEDIIRAARTSVFFVDDNQALRPSDIGSERGIRTAAAKYGAQVSHYNLSAQFRCSGAEGFLNWIGTVLGLLSREETANASGWDQSVFDFGIVDTPQEILDYVHEKNADIPQSDIKGHSVIHGARLLAGYAWPWTKENNLHAQVKDVIVGEADQQVALPWNNKSASYRWALSDLTREEVGCVHTSQGLEFDYVGVFIGRDLCYDEQNNRLKASYDHYYDTGGKNGLGTGREQREKNLLKYVCRAYRVLLSRGIRGARVYCEDPGLRRYLRRELAEAENLTSPMQ